MYARVLTFTGVQDFDAAVRFLEGTALSTVRSQHGYKGMSASADRSNGVLGLLSQWETAADREASESALTKTREDAKGQFATGLTVETFEERAVEVRRPPEVGSALMVTRIRMDPAGVDEIIDFFQREIAPKIAESPGFRALRNMVNPETGKGMVGTAWDDQQAMEAIAEAAMARRPDAERRGVTFEETSYREIVFIDAG
jgi:heme-degrading monooxygenase HmoA